ncbi:2-C-methyl-D-erythritol 4-phosphate cytidylyltransferase [Alteromonas sp. C1M14]|uniref:2-C-methyl-D-erythritol 4-phosphate cytidylyltransferase n=1 Tax=Alteromonas sp. C1M14 TaxID=2841567 RepID=UPI001C09A825|nr:2-C-methyl-D-erythritol 4-phosphate cytidylyltransferase [Alteromonas sp. C1M14]MBU2977529.1 2-C-methyl-D-erythritol 4-phosphate cytidylyltransferase [Alteromonas sp. C1M14]
MTEPSVVAVVPAAGVGSRMQADRPKQYLTLAGKTILEHTLTNLHAHSAIDHIVVAINKEDPWFPTLPVAKAPWLTVVEGGKERADSVLSGLSILDSHDWALVHDAARPCLRHSDLDTLLALRQRDDVVGGILATPVRDTMKRANAGSQKIAHTESREHLWHALTPQLFPAVLLKQALLSGMKNGLTITDEASAMEAQGYTVALIDSHPGNIKITQPADLSLAEFYLKQLTPPNC